MSGMIHGFARRRRWLAAALLLPFGLAAPLAAAAEMPGESATQLPVRGVVRASAEANITSDLPSVVTKIGFKEGERFKKGDVLLSFNCRKQRAELASAEARHREMAIALKSARFLNTRNAGSRQEVETSRARADKAAADAEIIRAQLSRCRIKAPYNGRVAAVDIHAHELPAPGKRLISIVSEQDPEIELIVPSAWLTWLARGTRFRFLIDETGTEHIGVVTRLSAAVDAVSQTIKVFARFESPASDILSGMSGTASFGPK